MIVAVILFSLYSFLYLSCYFGQNGLQRSAVCLVGVPDARRAGVVFAIAAPEKCFYSSLDYRAATTNLLDVSILSFKISCYKWLAKTMTSK